MMIVMFYHSLVSDWNHGNAHFLRGVVKELIRRGNTVKVFEPSDGWSLSNLSRDHGPEAINEFRQYYPTLESTFYQADNPDYDTMLKGADLVITHEWNDPELVAAVGALKYKFGYKLLFHDTHHRGVSDAESISSYDFSHYDGILAFGQVLGDVYQKHQWAKNVYVWHEAADHTLFYPKENVEKTGDLVWIGNWGDNEREEELNEYLINPVKELGLKATVYGVRYPEHALKKLEAAGVHYAGWLPNYKAPDVFAQYKVTVHVPRKPYVESLPGIPTIRPFEAMACGIPLISAPWSDSENLFSPGEDFIMVKNGDEMKDQIRMVLKNQEYAERIARHGRQTILKKHTCSHRVNELEKIARRIGVKQQITSH